MEKFFIITDECEYKKDYLDYKQNIKDVNEVIKELFDEVGIETSKYCALAEQLYIVPTENDFDNFYKILNKPIDMGLRGFKKRSDINKSYLKKFKDKGVQILNRPSIWMYMNGMYGHMRTTTSLVGDIMYLKLSTDYDRDVNEKGFNEIKASEYYLAIESN